MTPLESLQSALAEYLELASKATAPPYEVHRGEDYICVEAPQDPNGAAVTGALVFPHEQNAATHELLASIHSILARFAEAVALAGEMEKENGELTTRLTGLRSVLGRRAVELAALKAERDAAVLAERKRCDEIIRAARFGKIDPDWRSIGNRIVSGSTGCCQDD